MCGIAGFCLAQNENIDARKLSLALLGEIEVRGTDASGAAWVIPAKQCPNHRATIAVSKAPVRASKFEQYLVKMPKNAKRAILHTRYATQGSPYNNLNNHPIISGRVVGVHNGHLNNDKAVFKYLRSAQLGGVRVGEVDSEAAFALLDSTTYQPYEVLDSLQGRAALAWFDARDKRDLHLARVADSPLAIGQTDKDSLIFASTMPLLVKACQSVGLHLRWAEEIEPRTYLKVRNGVIEELETIGASLKEIA